MIFEEKIWKGWFNLPGPLPRNLKEVLDNPKRFERLLKKNGVLGKRENVASIETLAKILSEPAKQATAGSIRVVINELDGKTRELKLFCKFQSGRGMPRWLQALRAAAEPGICREVDFYSQIRASVPIKTPKPILAVKVYMLNYVFLALEYIDIELGQARVVNDSTGATLSEVTCMMNEIAKLHSRYSLLETDPETAWIPAKRGLEFAQWVESFNVKSDTIWKFKVFSALKQYFAYHPVTLVHGDCRPGNMLFQGNDRNNTSGVIFCDWEATNIAPYLWDFTYCTTLGWSAKSRREYSEQVLISYINALAIQPQNIKIDVETAKLDVALLTLVLGFVSFTIRATGFWNNQGNTRKDITAWTVRISYSLIDLNAEHVSKLLNIDVDDIVEIQKFCESQLKLLTNLEPFDEQSITI